MFATMELKPGHSGFRPFARFGPMGWAAKAAARTVEIGALVGAQAVVKLVVNVAR